MLQTLRLAFCLQVLGAHMVGPDSAEIMQGIAIALKAGAKKVLFVFTEGSCCEVGCILQLYGYEKLQGNVATTTCWKVRTQCLPRWQVHFDSTVGIHPTAAEEWVSMRSRTRRVQGRGSKTPT